jgi:subtilase family serine protease
MLLRAVTVTFLLSAAALAASHKPVCPGPAAAGTARCHARVITDAKGIAKAAALPSGYGSTDFRTAYGLTSSGTAVTVAIVDAYDDPNIESDLAVYSSTYGLPPCTTANGCFKKVNQTGGTSYPTRNAGWSLEIALDIETVHAVCPVCHILLVEASSNSFANLFVAEDYATAHASVVSNSWGGGEFSSETTSAYDGHFNRMHVPITFSSGDGGYGVEFPAASQYVTAVGGTTLTLNTDHSRKSETVWSGAGSGCSAYEPKPSWQTDTGCVRRTVADVSADADPNTGAAVYDTVRYQGRSGWFQVGGTSLASPLIAAIYALANNESSTTDGSYPYSHPGSLFDVTSGSNGSCSGSYLCTGKTGYDGPSGLGTPNGTGAF